MTKDTNKTSNKKRPWLIAISHFLGWLLFFSIPFFLRDGHKHMPMPPHNDMRPGKDIMLYTSIITDVFLVTIFYLNILLLCPLFTKEKRYGRFLMVQAGVAAVYYLSLKGITSLFIERDGFMPVGMQMFNYVLIVLVALCYSLVRETIRIENEQNEKENETLKSELSFLRWQISPHFLFNVLNNMVSLARVRSDKLEGMLLNLSSLMRYMLYETDDKKVLICREAEYLESYIALQKMRFGNEVTIHSEINVADNCDGCSIEPMLLIPFVENAFKHGTGNIAKPVIDIVIHFDHRMVTMTVKNRYDEKEQSLKDETHGIGLPNVKRRLNLLYPLKHSLSSVKKSNVYIATLGINIG